MIRIKKVEKDGMRISSETARMIAKQLIYAAEEADDHGLMAVTLVQSEVENKPFFNIVIRGKK
jgi:hypothetical protein